MNLKQRRMLLCLTAASGSVPNLEVAVRAAGCLPTPDEFEAAAAAGSLEACQWLHQQAYHMSDAGPLDGGLVLSAAAGGGHMHVCAWLMTLDVHWVPGEEEAAVEGGHVALMEWFIQRRPQLRYRWPHDGVRQKQLLAAAAARGCDLPALQRLWPRWGQVPDNGYKGTALAAAAGSPTPDWASKVEWLEGQGCPRTQAAAIEAAACPNALDRLTWLRGRGYPLGARAVEAAAESGNTAALHFLLGEGVQPQVEDDQAAICAAEGGHLPALQALHAAGWPVDTVEVAAAAAGHLHVVAWLVEALGATLDAGLFDYSAALCGSVELMAWLRQRGCEWDAEAFSSAAESGCEEALEWLVAQGCPVPEDGCLLYSFACRNGDLATARCLRRLGVPWGDPRKLLSDAVHREPLPVVRFLLEAGCPVDIEAAEAAAAARIAQAGEGSAAAARAAEAQTTEALGLIRQHLQRQQQTQEQHGQEQQRQRQEAR